MLGSSKQRITACAALALCLLAGSVAARHVVQPLEDRPPTDWLGPQPMDAAKAGIGTRMPDMLLEQVFAGPVSLHNILGSRGTVILVRDPECPVSRTYGPRLARYARQYHDRGFNFIVLYVNRQIGPVATAADAGGFDGPAWFITGDTSPLEKALGVHSTGDVFLLDGDGRLVYRGAVDDQYGLGYSRELPMRRWLERALDAVLAGTKVAVPATTAPGCYIDNDPDAEPTLQPWSPEEQHS
jgi:hypothetical protein